MPLRGLFHLFVLDLLWNYNELSAFMTMNVSFVIPVLPTTVVKWML